MRGQQWFNLDALPLHASLQGTADQHVTLRSRLILKLRLCKVAIPIASHAQGVLTQELAASSVTRPRPVAGTTATSVVTGP